MNVDVSSLLYPLLCQNNPYIYPVLLIALESTLLHLLQLLHFIITILPPPLAMKKERSFSATTALDHAKIRL